MKFLNLSLLVISTLVGQVSLAQMGEKEVRIEPNSSVKIMAILDRAGVSKVGTQTHSYSIKNLNCFAHAALGGAIASCEGTDNLISQTFSIKNSDDAKAIRRTIEAAGVRVKLGDPTALLKASALECSTGALYRGVKSTIKKLPSCKITVKFHPIKTIPARPFRR